MPEIITRAEAKARGLKRYFTGEPCKRGHICERFVSSSGCFRCVYIWADRDRRKKGVPIKRKNPELRAKWLAENRERLRAKQAAWAASNPEKIKAAAFRHREKKRALRQLLQQEKSLSPRQEAKAKGLKWYFDGKPCPQGHLGLRLVANWGCRECAKQRQDKYRSTPECHAVELNYNRRWTAKNKAHKRAAKRKWDEQNKDHVRAYNRRLAPLIDFAKRWLGMSWRDVTPEMRAAIEKVIVARRFVTDLERKINDRS